MAKGNNGNERRQRIHRRVRKKIHGTADRPRLAVFRSLRHIYVQAIDDDGHRTLASASTGEKAFQDQTKNGGNRDASKVVGGMIAERLKALGVEKVVFDRGGYEYHGRVQSLAEGAREKGLVF